MKKEYKRIIDENILPEDQKKLNLIALNLSEREIKKMKIQYQKPPRKCNFYNSVDLANKVHFKPISLIFLES